MKTEINNENKKKFFGQYFGQKIYREHSNPLVNDWVDIIEAVDSNSYLTLKPLSSISDEDATQIGFIYGGFVDTKDDLQDYKDHVQLALIEDDEEAYAMWDHVGFQTMSQVIDYLRSKSYALPWMGLSVEEMVNAGWIKLVES